MENKQLFNDFITKYHLNNNIESAVLRYMPKDDKKGILKTMCSNSTNNIVANIVMKGIYLGDEQLEFGVFNTKQLISQISILSDIKKVKFTKSNDTNVTLLMSDGVAKSEFVLSDISIINVPKLNEKAIPEPEIKIKIDAQFREFFNRINKALSDVSHFAITTENDKLVLSMGQSTGSKSHNASFILTDLTEKDYNHSDIHFNSADLAEILANNKGEAEFNISLKGIATLEFKTSNSKATYYLLKKEVK